MLFLAFTNVCHAPSTPSQMVSNRACWTSTGFTIAARRQDAAEQVGADASYGDPVSGKIHNQMRGNCPRLGIKALVSAHTNSRLQTQVFLTKGQNDSLAWRGCTVTKEPKDFVPFTKKKNHQLLQYKINVKMSIIYWASPWKKVVHHQF